jgi:response regulator RpfG family c-di-GMP phosphodiesterase
MTNRVTENDELLFFAEEESNIVDLPVSLDKWKILIVDDEPEIHNVTKMVLREVSFEGKSLEFISAYSAKEALELIPNLTNLAMILLDVVMETEDAGLRLVQDIRKGLQNETVRIVLRTGQPGKAPEFEIITQYDINDYKEKTELTLPKLFTTVISCLRSYRDITKIAKSKKSLEKIIKCSPELFEFKNMQNFASAMLKQLISILELDETAGHFSLSSMYSSRDSDEDIVILAGTGEYSKYQEKKAHELLHAKEIEQIKIAFEKKLTVFPANKYLGYFKSRTGRENVVYLNGANNLSEMDKYLITLYNNYMSTAFDNIQLNEENNIIMQEMIFKLGDLVDLRSQETNFHVKRVAEYSRCLANLYGIAENDIEMLYIAAPLHDVGKIGVPDYVLNKPGKLTQEEFEIMKTHCQIGEEVLEGSSRPIMKLAAIIASQHHERYNGQGYPRGLKEEEIHIAARIVSIADVFDALNTNRVYKQAWSSDQIIAYFNQELGNSFDPVLTKLFLENIEEFNKINELWNQDTKHANTL